MSKEESAMMLITMVGSLTVLMVPAAVGIIWKVYSEAKKATEANTLAINSLTTKIDILWSMTLDIPKMKKDLDVAHERIRTALKKSIDDE